jgi:hypothetical protein
LLRRIRTSQYACRRCVYLRTTSNGDDAGEEVSDHCFQGNTEAVHVHGVDEPQTVLHRGGTQSEDKNNLSLTNEVCVENNTFTT